MDFTLLIFCIGKHFGWKLNILDRTRLKIFYCFLEGFFLSNEQLTLVNWKCGIFLTYYFVIFRYWCFPSNWVCFQMLLLFVFYSGFVGNYSVNIVLAVSNYLCRVHSQILRLFLSVVLQISGCFAIPDFCYLTTQANKKSTFWSQICVVARKYIHSKAHLTHKPY